MLSNVIANQKVHEQYGGVVPELASRAHQSNILPVIDQALQQAKVSKSDLSAVAITKGPGLLGSLLVGTSFAKSLSLGLEIPLIEVNHMRGHVLAHFIGIDNRANHKPTFPFLCLTVSGGHTQIVLVKSPMEMTVIGQTIDDAAGEAFDKAAKMLGLAYPGGPLVDKFAKQGDPNRFSFSVPKVDNLDYSFSGLKTQFLYFLKAELKSNDNFISLNLNDICASFQKHIVKVLLQKLEIAAKQHNIQDIAIAGGVAANSGLRNGLEKLASKNGWRTFIPEFQFCTDNAAMIAVTGYYKYLNNDFASLNLAPQPRLKLGLT